MNRVGFNVALSLPLLVDKDALMRDLSACLNESWPLHFNAADYSGNWTALALRSSSGKASDILAGNGDSSYSDTALMEKCVAVKNVLASLLFEKGTVRFMRLDPDAEIKEHCDPGLSYRYGDFRLHIPLTTDDKVEFLVGGHLIPMKVGECWYADFDLPHSVRNRSDRERIHLVVDGKRNEWTDDFFGGAGYDFNIEEQLSEKNHDAETMRMMIDSLQQMGNSVSKQLILDLEKKLKAKEESDKAECVPDAFEGWFPDHITPEGKVHWTFSGHRKMDESFFEQGMTACRKYHENRLWNGWTEIDQLVETAQPASIQPTAFIFHISRCGSTLLTQMLAHGSDAIAISEPPVLDEILSMYTEKSSNRSQEKMFRNAVAYMGTSVRQPSQHYVIKLDSWHILHYEKIRAMYPAVPFVLLYRDPSEVLRSHSKVPGRPAVPGMIDPQLLGSSAEEVTSMTAAVYADHIMCLFLEKFIEVAEKDSNAFLFSYHEGAEELLRKFCDVTDMPYDEKLKLRARERLRFHSKDKKAAFSSEADSMGNGKASSRLEELFKRLEQMRLSIPAV